MRIGLNLYRAACAYPVDDDMHSKGKPIKDAATVQNVFDSISKGDGELVTKSAPEL
jgi:hypothetical protein